MIGKPIWFLVVLICHGAGAVTLSVRPKLWLLDRDGCINHDVGAPGVICQENLLLIPGSAGAIRRLRLSARVAIVTNQSARGKGLLSKCELEAIHQRMRHLIATTARGGLASQDGKQWDAIYVCEDAGPSATKKPAPGMVLAALADFGCDPDEAVMFGDSWSDVVAAQRAGCHSVMLGTGHGASLGACLRRQAGSLPATLTAEALAESDGTPASALGDWVAQRSASETELMKEALRRADVRVYENLAQAADELIAKANEL